MINIGLYLTYALIFVAAAGCIIFPAIQMIKNPKGAKKSMIGIAVMLVLFIICYALASSDVLPAWSEKFGTTEGASKRIGGALGMFYIMMTGAILLAVGMELKQLIKK